MDRIKNAYAWAKLHVVIALRWAWLGISMTGVELVEMARTAAKLPGKAYHAALAALEKAFFLVLLFCHKLLATAPTRLWRGLKLTVQRAGFAIAIGTRYYKNWSHLYQWLYERQYANILVTLYPTLDQLHQVVSSCTWTSDGPKELGDAFSSAGYIQHVIDSGGARAIGDCDEFAMYNSTAIWESVQHGIWKDRAIKDTKLLTVRWLMHDGSFEGHNVCLIEWADGKFSYVDYYNPSSEADSWHAVALQVIKDYGGRDCAGWSVAKRDMTPVKIGWK
jgi:hypothetical protein